MTPKEIVAKFDDALDQVDPIDGHLSGTDLTLICEVLAPLLIQIPYNKTEGTHNLISLIRPVEAYTTRYGSEFAEPARVRAYDAKIDDNATSVVRMRMEVAHKSKRVDRGTYKTARRTITNFILSVIEDMLVL